MQDMNVLHQQERKLAQKPHGWRDYYLATQSDTGVASFWRWLGTFAGWCCPFCAHPAHLWTSEALNACRLGSSWLTPLCSTPSENPGSQGKPMAVACMLCVIHKHDLQVGMWSGQMGSPLSCPQRGASRN